MIFLSSISSKKNRWKILPKTSRKNPSVIGFFLHMVVSLLSPFKLNLMHSVSYSKLINFVKQTWNIFLLHLPYPMTTERFDQVTQVAWYWFQPIGIRYYLRLLLTCLEFRPIRIFTSLGWMWKMKKTIVSLQEFPSLSLLCFLHFPRTLNLLSLSSQTPAMQAYNCVKKCVKWNMAIMCNVNEYSKQV